MYELSFEDKVRYLHVTASGDLDSATDIAIDEDIRRECKTRNFDLVLIDIRPMSSRMTGIDNHIAAKSFRQRMGLDIRAIAIVDSIDHEEKSKLYELTAINRGARVSFFTDDVEAGDWLTSYPKS